MSKTSSASKNKYNLKAYDRVGISVKKGLKDVWKCEAEKQGKSLSAFIVDAVELKIKTKGGQ